MEHSEANRYADKTAFIYLQKRFAAMPKIKEAAKKCKNLKDCEALIPDALLPTYNEVRESAFEAAKEM
jgi:hypothetical protein